MPSTNFPAFTLSDWKNTRDTIHNYAKVIGRIRRDMTPFQKHWWHITLHVTANGLTTTPILYGDTTFDLTLNFLQNQLEINTNQGIQEQFPLAGQSIAGFYQETKSALINLGIEIPVDDALFTDETGGDYDENVLETFWKAFSQIDVLFKTFRAELNEETSPVHVFPHHFDLSFAWFSGRIIPDKDPEDLDESREMMGFGYSTGDSMIEDGYFYGYAYPTPDGMMNEPLPDGAEWMSEGFTGGVLKYADLLQAENPQETLLSFLRSVQQAGAKFMQ